MDEAPERDTPDTEPDAPDTSTEDGGTRDQETYEKRYNDLRSEFDRRNQQWSEFQAKLANPDDFVRELGYEIGDDEDDDYDDDDLDPVESLRAEVEALKQARVEETSQAQAEQMEQAEVSYINDQLGQVIDEAGRDFTQDEIDALGDLSRVRTDDQGRPDVKGAYKLIYGTILEQQKEGWVKSKSAPQIPGGGAGGEKPDLDNPQVRQDYIASRLAQIDAEQ